MVLFLQLIPLAIYLYRPIYWDWRWNNWKYFGNLAV